MHYMNQFFAGIGGEDRADVPVGSFVGPVGPGKHLQELLGDSAQIVVTAYCGDDYFATHSEEALASILKVATACNIDMLVAGPAFASGRHGFACAEICHAVSTSLDLPCVGAMSPDNPGVGRYKHYKDRKVFLLPAAGAVSGMEDALTGMAQYVSKLASGVAIGPASEEGYIPRGLRFNRVVSKIGAERAVDTLLDKLAGRPFTTEVPVEYFETVPVASRVADLSDACIALVTTMGVLPPGNPDGFKVYRNNQWRKYSIGSLDSMHDTKWDVVHGGYNSAWMIDNANYCVPVDACRKLEKEGVIAQLYPYFYSTNGGMGFISAMQAIGREIAGNMKAEGVDATILVSA